MVRICLWMCLVAVALTAIGCKKDRSKGKLSNAIKTKAPKPIEVIEQSSVKYGHSGCVVIIIDWKKLVMENVIAFQQTSDILVDTWSETYENAKCRYLAAYAKKNVDDDLLFFRVELDKESNNLTLNKPIKIEVSHQLERCYFEFENFDDGKVRHEATGIECQCDKLIQLIQGGHVLILSPKTP